VQNILSSSLLSKNLKNKIYRTIILPVVLYGFQTWVLTLREERCLRVFENRVVKGIFGSKRDKVRREWIKLHNEEHEAPHYVVLSTPFLPCPSVLLTQYFAGDKIDQNEMGWACSVYGAEVRRILDFVGETSGKETTWETHA